MAQPLKLAIAGTGYVGLVSGVCLAEVGHQVTCVDVDESKVAKMKGGVSPIYEPGLQELMQSNYSAGRLTYTTDYEDAYRNADVIFIGVGTPEQPDGSANLAYIAKVARQIAQSIVHDCLVVVKSTVPIGTNEKVEQFIKDFLAHNVHVDVASNPEFLAQGSAVHDTMHADRIIIGTNSCRAETLLKQIYEPFKVPIISVDRRSAEMIKYASNVFLALKISYMNDLANLCEIVGADIQNVANGMSYDDRIGRRFLNAGIGFGGSCFPKDTKALCYLAGQNGYELRIVQAAIDVNQTQRTVLFKKASQRLISFDGLKIAVLGLAFKPETDDLREAPSIPNIQLLLKHGAHVHAYDPVAKDRFQNLMQPSDEQAGTFELADCIDDALKDACACFIFTEWGCIKDISPVHFKNLMRTPLIYDGRNIYDVEEMKQVGVEYYSIGR